MTWKMKREVLDVMRECALEPTMESQHVRYQLMAAVENIPEEDECCCGPNYEAMYHEAMEKLQKTELVQESMRNEIQQLHFVNARLVGFKEAIELVQGKGRDCHGCP